jgi:hypothetical protein
MTAFCFPRRASVPKKKTHFENRLLLNKFECNESSKSNLHLDHKGMHQSKVFFVSVCACIMTRVTVVVEEVRSEDSAAQDPFHFVGV